MRPEPSEGRARQWESVTRREHAYGKLSRDGLLRLLVGRPDTEPLAQLIAIAETDKVARLRLMRATYRTLIGSPSISSLPHPVDGLLLGRSLDLARSPERNLPTLRSSA
jgi:hypothetical protein